MTRAVLLGLMLAADAGTDFVLQDSAGQRWTIRSDPTESLGEGMASRTVHHVLRGDREVKALEDFASRQRNPTMASSTRWQFRLDAKGRFEAQGDSSTSKNHQPQSASQTRLRWNGTELAPVSD